MKLAYLFALILEHEIIVDYDLARLVPAEHPVPVRLDGPDEGAVLVGADGRHELHAVSGRRAVLAAQLHRHLARLGELELGHPQDVQLAVGVAEHERVVAEGDGDDGVVVAGPEEHHAGELVRVEVQDAGGGGGAVTFTPES